MIVVVRIDQSPVDYSPHIQLRLSILTTTIIYDYAIVKWP